MPALDNPKHEAFCHAIVAQKYPTAVAAYLAEFLAKKDVKQVNSHRVRVAELMRDGTPVAIRIAEIRAEIAAKFEKAKTDMNATFLTIEEKRRFLARVVRCNYTKIAPTIKTGEDGEEVTVEASTFDFEKDGDLIQGIKQTKFGIEYVMHDKLKAIQLDNDFPGGGGVPDTASKLLERLILPGIPADRVPMMLDGPIIDVETPAEGQQ
jgi:hypothetical protein